MTKYELLSAAIRDESLPLLERKTAAEHYILELVNAVPVPADDTPEVIELMKPWKNEAFAASFAKLTNGISTTGHTLANAKNTVLRRRRLRTVLEVIVDEQAHRLQQLAACKKVLDEHLCSRFAYNHYSPEKMLDAVIPATAFKWTSEGKAPVERPPRTLADVW